MAEVENPEKMMPSDMRLQCPSEDTPPSTRPPSVASSATSTSGLPHRSTSMDSLHTNSSISDKPTGEESIPTRLIRAAPKANANAMQFVKTGPALLHKSAKEQMKKAEVVKSLRKSSLQEEEEWQSSTSHMRGSDADGSDWQTNLDKWKNSRRKRNEDVLERVIEVKRNEQDEEFSKTRRKSKTFNEIQEDKSKRGRRYHLVVHDNDNSDLSDLGLTSGKNGSSLSDPPEETEVKYADTKSDAGFCTGSDTGSDGVFAEDSISDTSSAMGDKREIHDSLLESGLPPPSKECSEVIVNGHETEPNGHLISEVKRSDVYTYDKAIEDYKQFAENSAKKRTSSVTSLSSTASKEEVERISCALTKSSSAKKIEEKLSFFDGKGVAEPRFLRRERNTPKVDLDKRRSMFELRDFDTQVSTKVHRRSVDISSSLKSKVASFETLSDGEVRRTGVTPPRDSKFKEKLASFTQKEKEAESSSPRKKTPERDQNFYQKLHSFSQLESRSSSSLPRLSPDKKTSSWRASSSLSPSLPSSERLFNRRAPPPTPLKDRIASFENLSVLEASSGRRELSVSMENLHKRPISDRFSVTGTSLLQGGSQSVSNLFRRTPSTPFMVVEVDEVQEEKTCIRNSVTRVSDGAKDVGSNRRRTVYEEVEKTVIIRDVGSAPIYSIFRMTEPEDYELKSPKLEKESNGDPTIPACEAQDSSCALSAKSEVRPMSPLGVPYSSMNGNNETDTPKKAPIALPENPEIRTGRTLPKTPETRPPEPPVISKASSETCNTLPDSHRTLPDVPRTLPETPKTLSEAELQIPGIPSPKITEISDSMTGSFAESTFDLPPPVPPPRVPDSEDSSSAKFFAIEPKILSKEGEKEKFQQESSSPSHEYGDEDIDEVMDDYEHLSEAITVGDGGAFGDGKASPQPLQQENFYEKIEDEDPLYENIYEKVSLEENTISLSSGIEHQYQTLEEVENQRDTLPPVPSASPPLLPKTKNLSVYEVLDVTWTEDLSSSPAIPPSVAPPPPPPDEEEEEEQRVEGPKSPDGARESTHCGSPTHVQNEDRSLKSGSKSKNSTKQELRKKMSDFLGTKPQIEEVVLQPPPNMNELLRQEREAERLLLQKQASLARESPLLDFDFGLQPLSRPKYTWEDRMKADGPKDPKPDLDESTDTLDIQNPKKSKASTIQPIDVYRKYVSHFSAPNIFIKNIHNNTEHQTIVRHGIMKSSSQTDLSFSSSENFKDTHRTSEKEETSKKAVFTTNKINEKYTHSGSSSSLVKHKSVPDLFTNNYRSRESRFRTSPVNVEKGKNFRSSHLSSASNATKKSNNWDSKPSKSDSPWRSPTVEAVKAKLRDENSKNLKTLQYILPKQNKAIEKNASVASLSPYADSCFRVIHDTNYEILPDVPTTLPTIIADEQTCFDDLNGVDVYSSRTLPDVPSSMPDNYSVCSSPPLLSSTISAMLDTITFLLKESSSSKSSSQTVPVAASPATTSTSSISLIRSDSEKLCHAFATTGSTSTDYTLSDSSSTVPSLIPINISRSPSSTTAPSSSISVLTTPPTNASQILTIAPSLTPLTKACPSLAKAPLTSASAILAIVPSRTTHTLTTGPSLMPLKNASPTLATAPSLIPPTNASPKLTTGPPLTNASPTVTTHSLPRNSTLHGYQSPHLASLPTNASHAKLSYTPEDPSVRSLSLNKFASLFELEDFIQLQNKKLAELEQEMEKHDRSMLQRVKGPIMKEEPIFSKDFSPDAPSQTQYSATYQSDSTEPAGNITTTHPVQSLQNSPSNQASTLPLQEFYTAPTFNKMEGMSNSQEKTLQEKGYSESLIMREPKQVVREEPLPPKALPQVPPPIPRKQSILALSAIPKPKLTDNDSWIMKRKAEVGKKDYNKHWLIQEAEQRRLEQQERISRPSQLPINKATNPLHSTQGFQSHFQNIQSSFSSSTSYSPNQTPSPINNGPVLSPLSPSKPISPPCLNPTSHNFNSMNELPSNKLNNGQANISSQPSNNNWKKQTKTYQPPQPSPPAVVNKPLPDSIINTITQRVNSKNKNNGSGRPTVYNSNNYRNDDSYHDYMNTDTFNTTFNNNHAATGVQSPQGTHLPPGNLPQGSHLSQGNQASHMSEDQRLLSVSGKKKCSHCGEELGRGAAMIIESLRLFYHIPCFKCCVCGTQLGNGTSGADVRVRNHKLHCHNCYSNDEGMKFSKV